MPSMIQRSSATVTIMLLSGIILVSTVAAQVTPVPAIQDIQDLRTIINAAVEKIEAGNNSGWFPSLGSSNEMGTADLVENITSTILRANYNLEVNQTSWLNRSNAAPPTLPITGSILLPTESPSLTPVPTSVPPVTVSDITLSPPFTLTPLPSVSASVAPTDTLRLPPLAAAAIPPTPLAPNPLPPSIPDAAGTTLDDPYIDYISSIPNLSTALTTLGRSWHREMNKPVWDAIDALQQTINTFSSALLQAELIHSQAIIRTIRASATLEDAQQAWSRFLNLPGSSKGTSGADGTGSEGSSSTHQGSGSGSGRDGPGEGLTGGGITKRTSMSGVKRPAPVNSFYRHKDLWGREAKPSADARESREGKSRLYDAFVEWEEHVGLIPRAFVA